MLLKFVGNTGRNKVVLSDNTEVQVEYNKEVEIPDSQVNNALQSGLFTKDTIKVETKVKIKK